MVLAIGPVYFSEMIALYRHKLFAIHFIEHVEIISRLFSCYIIQYHLNFSEHALGKQNATKITVCDL